jgi:hypothetical protein
VDSILTFEWTHNKVQESALKLNNLIISSTMDGHESCKGDLLLESLSTIVNKKLRYHGNKSKATILIDCIWNDAFLDGKVQSCMIERVCQHMRCNVFTPSKILKAMDLAGFNLSLAAIEVLKSVETADKRYSRGFLPSKSSILRAARKVEKCL